MSTRMARPLRALIAGGGIGGLASAIALRQIGCDVTVFERAPGIITIGNALHLWTNGIRALQVIDAGDRVVGAGVVIEKIQFRDWRGRMLLNAKVGELGRRHGAPAAFVRHVRIIEALAEGLDPEVIRFGAGVVSFEQDAAGVTIRLADGSEERGDFLLIADGLHSRFRSAIAGPVEPRRAGYYDTVAIVDMQSEAIARGEFWMLQGRGQRFGLAHVGDGKLFWAASLNGTYPAAAGPGDWKTELRQRFRKWAVPVEAVIEATPEASLWRGYVEDIPPLDRWGNGLVMMIGDAAHATTPNLGRGAGEAMEDAVTVMRCISALGTDSSPERIAEALRSFERIRRAPTATVTTRSRRLGGVFQSENRLVGAIRDGVIRWTPVPIIRRAIGVEADFKRHF